MLDIKLELARCIIFSFRDIFSSHSPRCSPCARSPNNLFSFAMEAFRYEAGDIIVLLMVEAVLEDILTLTRLVG